MSDYRRWRIEGGTYFFTVVTYQRQRFLVKPQPRKLLREAIEAVRQNHPFEIVAWVLLPDHLHAVWSLPRGDADYSVRWRQIKSLFTRNYLLANPVLAANRPSRQRHEERSVWQSRFYEHTCRDEDDVKRCVDYVHINPVKHGLVDRLVDWPWSSFHRYVTLGEYPCDWTFSPKEFGEQFDEAE